MLIGTKYNQRKTKKQARSKQVKTCLSSNLLMRMMLIMLLVILGGLFGGCASNPGAGGEVLSGVLMGIGTGLSGL